MNTYPRILLGSQPDFNATGIAEDEDASKMPPAPPEVMDVAPGVIYSENDGRSPCAPSPVFILSRSLQVAYTGRTGVVLEGAGSNSSGESYAGRLAVTLSDFPPQELVRDTDVAAMRGMYERVNRTVSRQMRSRDLQRFDPELFRSLDLPAQKCDGTTWHPRAVVELIRGSLYDWKAATETWQRTKEAKERDRDASARAHAGAIRQAAQVEAWARARGFSGETLAQAGPKGTNMSQVRGDVLAELLRAALAGAPHSPAA